MRVKRRKKVTRHPGNKTHGRGRKNRTRGSGNQGGVGLSGTGKRGDQKKTLVLKLYGGNYFGKELSARKKKQPSLSLEVINKNILNMVRKGIAKEDKNSYEVHLEDYKIIGNTKPTVKLVIHAKAASAGALEAVKSTGGEIKLSS